MDKRSERMLEEILKLPGNGELIELSLSHYPTSYPGYRACSSQNRTSGNYATHPHGCWTFSSTTTPVVDHADIPSQSDVQIVARPLRGGHRSIWVYSSVWGAPACIGSWGRTSRECESILSVPYICDSDSASHPTGPVSAPLVIYHTQRETALGADRPANPSPLTAGPGSTW